MRTNMDCLALEIQENLADNLHADYCANLETKQAGPVP